MERLMSGGLPAIKHAIVRAIMPSILLVLEALMSLRDCPALSPCTIEFLAHISSTGLPPCRQPARVEHLI